MRWRPNLTNKDDIETLKDLNAEPWMIDLLNMNPDYTHWGPSEDYMLNEGEGWNSRIVLQSWSDFKWDLDDYNEIVHFYFEVCKESDHCKTCNGLGWHPDSLSNVQIGKYDLAKLCNDCKGKSYWYTSSPCYMKLVLWALHPRKGASRGIRIEKIEQSDLPAIFKMLRLAADRNAERFSRIPST